MDCEKALELMSAELDGMCTEQERAALQAHLEACADCRETYRQLRALDEALQDAELEPPQADRAAAAATAPQTVRNERRVIFFIMFSSDFLSTNVFQIPGTFSARGLSLCFPWEHHDCTPTAAPPRP